jgi:hypothetical protein
MTAGSTGNNEDHEPGGQPGWCSHIFVSDQDRLRGRYGSSCRARAVATKDLCAAHDPEHQRAVTERRKAREVAREAWRAQIRAEQLTLKARAVERAQAEIAESQAVREVARAVRRAVPHSVRVAHRRAQMFRSDRLRIQLYLRPDEVAALHDWFERRCDDERDAAAG